MKKKSRIYHHIVKLILAFISHLSALKQSHQRIKITACLFFICAPLHNSTAMEMNAHFQYGNYNNPYKKIIKLEERIKLNRDKNDVLFEDLTSLIELYFKTQQNHKAESVYKKIVANFYDNKKLRPKIALTKAHLEIFNFETATFTETLAPYISLYKSQESPELSACYYYLVGAFHIQQQNYEKALSDLNTALEIVKRHNNHHLEMSIKNQLVQFFYHTQQYEKALSISDDIISTAKVASDQFNEVSGLTNKMNIYYTQAVIFSSDKKPEAFSSHPTYQKLIKKSNILQQDIMRTSEKIGAYRSMARALIMQQNQHFSTNDFNQVVSTGKAIIELSKKNHFEYEIAVASNNMAIALRELGLYEQSLLALRNSETLYLKFNKLESLIWIYEDYAKTYEMYGKPEKALTYFKKFHDTSQAYWEKTKKKSLLEVQEQYETKEKEQEIFRLTQAAAFAAQQLETEKMGRWLLTMILIAVSAFGFILFQKRTHLQRLLTKEAELNHKIREVNRAKHRFLSNLSHEFRTALTLSISPLRSYLQSKSEKQCEPVESALENNLHMMTLLNEVLEIERLDEKNLPMSISKFDLNKAIESCLNRFQLQFKEKNILIKKHGFKNNIALHFDPAHLEKIIANILSNAGKYCPKMCTINIEVRESKNSFELIICDDGPGISQQELPYVFNRFYQGQSSMEKTQPGTGIGLSLVKELVELHSGSIEILSDTDKGCCVKINLKKGSAHYDKAKLVENSPTLKCIAETNTSCEQSQSNEASLPAETIKSADALKTSNNKSVSNQKDIIGEHNLKAVEHRQVILVVDDNQNIRKLIRNVLQPHYHIIEADNGQQAFKMAELIQPDLIITDVMMPLMNGFQLTEQLRANDQLAHLSIMLLTALPENEQKLHGLLMGADDYITKPFDNNELKARVKNHLAHKQRLSEKLLSDYRKNSQHVEPTPAFEMQIDKKSKALDLIIAKHLGESEFDVEQMFTALNMTRSSLYRYTQKVYGCSPKNLLKKRRLEMAYQMLNESKGTISEIAYAVGYQSLSAFSRAFSEYFEHPPTKMRHSATVKH